MKIVIAGAGNVGIHLAKLLADENQDITLIDESEQKLSRLDSIFDLLTIQESPVSLHGLKEAGAVTSFPASWPIALAPRKPWHELTTTNISFPRTRSISQA